MAKALIIRTDGSHQVKDFAEGKSYNLLRESVGGWIECVALPNLDIDMWVNEEGKLNGLAPNTIGTMLWITQYGYTDLIVGDIVLTGGADSEGTTLGLTDEQLESLLDFVS